MLLTSRAVASMIRNVSSSSERQPLRCVLRVAGKLHRQVELQALQVSYPHTGWNGVTSIVNYVYSKSLDNSSDGEDFEPNDAQPNDSTQPWLEYGPSNFDIPHRLTWNFGYDSPTVGGSYAGAEERWGHQQHPHPPERTAFPPQLQLLGYYSGAATHSIVPMSSDPIVYHKRDPYNYLDLSSFAIPCTVDPSVPVNGGVASDCQIGTAIWQHGTQLAERTNLQGVELLALQEDHAHRAVSMKLGVEFFNLLNHPNFANPLLPAFIADAGYSGNFACRAGK